LNLGYSRAFDFDIVMAIATATATVTATVIDNGIIYF
jgi:hypothetical protein